MLTSENPAYIILIAPNVSEKMGGEAIKAYRYFEYLLSKSLDVILFTHERCRPHLKNFPQNAVHFVKDSWLQKLAWKIFFMRPLIDPLFLIEVSKKIHALRKSVDVRVIHQITPISPIFPSVTAKGVKCIAGPLNGNIHFPNELKIYETSADRCKRIFYKAAARICSHLPFVNKKQVDLLLVSGGKRTSEIINLLGADSSKIRYCFDSGVDNFFFESSLSDYPSKNFRFYFIGRLVKYKGCELVLHALCQTDPKIELDIFGDGEERGELTRLAENLGLSNRVKFCSWLKNDPSMCNVLASYCALVLPTMKEANGIVVQEAMAMGLPIIALNWGGPAELVEHGKSGLLIEPKSVEYVTEMCVCGNKD